MPVSQAGALNTTALVVPDLYVQILEPSVSLLNGRPTDIAGVVGTASWGPINAPQIVGSMADYARLFGPIRDRMHDGGTLIAAAVLQGASNFRFLRVGDGTEAAASATLGGEDETLQFTAKYPGVVGNGIVVTMSTGSKAGTKRVIVALPGYASEQFDNIAPVDGKIAESIAKAVNLGTSTLRGPSQLVVVSTSGEEADGFTFGSATLAGGEDGADVMPADLIGSDAGTRTGMYALEGTGVSVVALADVFDWSTFSVQAAWGLANGAYMIATTQPGDTISAAVAAKATAGIDSYALKIMFGDWLMFSDSVNKVVRPISPQGFVLGRLANLAPHQSSLNKDLYGIVASQRSSTATPYSTAELQVLAQAGIDVITNPIPKGSVWGVRIGHNSSSDELRHGDNYTRMTNYLAFTLNGGLGQYVGQVQTPQVRAKAKGTINSFLGNLEQQGMVGNVNGGPAFSVQIDDKNNPITRVALGYMQADVRVTYLSVIEKFLVNLEGSQATTVRVTNEQ